MKNIIITGGTGFIGSHFVDYLINNNYNVTVITRKIKNSNIPMITSHSNLNDGGGSLKYIYCDFDYIDKLDINLKCDVLYNLAWSGVNSKLKNSIDVQLNNILMNQKIASFSKKIGSKLFISAGTVAEYTYCNGLIDVYKKQTPNDMYGAAKVATHYILDVFCSNNNLPFIWCLIPSTYGEGRVDDNIITYTIKELLKKSIPQYGKLLQTWDFLYVNEVCRALELIGLKGKAGKIYGIGSGEYKPLKEYVEIIRDIIDPTLPLGIGLKQELSTGVISSCVNINELTKDTGFKPVISFEDGIKLTIEWFKKNSYGII